MSRFGLCYQSNDKSALKRRFGINCCLFMSASICQKSGVSGGEVAMKEIFLKTLLHCIVHLIKYNLHLLFCQAYNINTYSMEKV